MKVIKWIFENRLGGWKHEGVIRIGNYRPSDEEVITGIQAQIKELTKLTWWYEVVEDEDD